MKELNPSDFYDCPINVKFDAMRLQIMEEQEGQIIKAVQNFGIEINKETLVEVLNRDRKRYEAAWQAGYNACKTEYEDRIKKIHERLKSTLDLVSEEKTNE